MHGYGGEERERRFDSIWNRDDVWSTRIARPGGIRSAPEEGKSIFFRIDYRSLCLTDNKNIRLLCDDPGLGKTITVMCLILRSFGLSTETRVNTDIAVDDCELFYSYWNSSFLTAHDRRTEVLRLITKPSIRIWNRHGSCRRLIRCWTKFRIIWKSFLLPLACRTYRIRTNAIVRTSRSLRRTLSCVFRTG